ncbi:hydrogenase formation protein HypD [Orenia metallireducens]|jgi:hydrogenase expression/formation protein HypD|uniref:Hydrogenase formation protein HypD n=1 Tax=Orenia metallireducens TaxID=1413210 RepID=A0A1C0ABJ7_9FIRM|nr:hydrogenase formation protein HypD [Orenia metallireducens]OCL27740.1 hydrogenase formation protein HypD [Orenia metallireducens]
MKYLEEFRDVATVKKMLYKLKLESNKKIKIMEVCGTHTMAIFRTGIRDLLPDNIELISGPGCPVCVTPQGYIDTAIELSKREDIIITTFADMMRVPGTDSSLQKQKALGANVRMVYSPLDAVKIAQDNPDKEVVFLAIGFETTIPTIALSVKRVEELNLNNYSILQSLKTMPATMEGLVLDEEIEIDGFICPGHVSTVIGVKPYEFLAEKYGVPAVVAGFESGDIVFALYKLLKMIQDREPKIENVYSRLVKYEGNQSAINIISDIFEVTNSQWRGLGEIKGSGLKLRNEYQNIDTEIKLGISISREKKLKGCICGEVLKGKKTPLECKLFSKACTPVNPIGACMVSEEGTCAAYYKYGKK